MSDLPKYINDLVESAVAQERCRCVKIVSDSLTKEEMLQKIEMPPAPVVIPASL